jgi:hypothetical protein
MDGFEPKLPPEYLSKEADAIQIHNQLANYALICP